MKTLNDKPFIILTDNLRGLSSKNDRSIYSLEK